MRSLRMAEKNNDTKKMQKLTIRNILKNTIDVLKTQGIINASFEAELICSHFLKISRTDIYLESERLITKQQADIINKATLERGNHKPLQYILETVYFYDIPIIVNENVLIPRPETEYMADLIIKSFYHSKPLPCHSKPLPCHSKPLPCHSERSEESPQPLTILDLCTGSGAIAIALKKNIPSSIVYAADICEKALEVAEQNTKNNNCEINLLKSDLFDAFTDKQPRPVPVKSKDEVTFVPVIARNEAIQNIFDKEWIASFLAMTDGGKRFLIISKYNNFFDIIISNPPYISEKDYETLQPELFFEPKKDLVADNNGLFFIEKIIKEAKQYLKKDGLLYLEIGHNQIDEIKKIVKDIAYSEFTIYKDLSGKERIVRIKF